MLEKFPDVEPTKKVQSWYAAWNFWNHSKVKNTKIPTAQIHSTLNQSCHPVHPICHSLRATPLGLSITCAWSASANGMSSTEPAMDLGWDSPTKNSFRRPPKTMEPKELGLGKEISFAKGWCSASQVAFGGVCKSFSVGTPGGFGKTSAHVLERFDWLWSTKRLCFLQKPWGVATVIIQKHLPWPIMIPVNHSTLLHTWCSCRGVGGCFRVWWMLDMPQGHFRGQILTISEAKSWSLGRNEGLFEISLVWMAKGETGRF